MQYLVPVIVGIATLAFILAPFWIRMGGSGHLRSTGESWHSLAQLDLDRELGKIDDAEYEELKNRIQTEAAPVPPLEALIYRFRLQRRLDTALEAEILIARARLPRK